MNTSRILMTLLIALTATATQAAPVHRYLLSVGTNNGGKERVMLRYAVSDATAFASVLTDMGGVERGNAVVLSNPSGRELLGGIAKLGRLIAKDKAAQHDARAEVFVYYSGHADESGLKLGAETLGWSEFRNAVSGLDAEVRVAVLDACGSGAITRAKGGVARPAFLSDASSNMKGYAFLTSSNENEASQESDRLKGSYFTHALLSGMRGAADMTGDGKVTINEAYQYAFNETLQNTQNTRAGTQHPSRDMNLAGTGDVVMTDLRETSATLSLDENLEGRFFIRDAGGNLFAELRKFRGRTVELGMPPGKYAIQMEAQSREWMAGNAEITAGKNTALSMSGMRAMGRREATTARGNGGPDGGAESGWNAPAIMAKIADRGMFTAEVYGDAEGGVGTTISAGTPWVYALFDYRQPAGGAWPKSWGGGLGTRFGMKPPFFINFDAALSNVRYSDAQWQRLAHDAEALRDDTGAIYKNYSDAQIKLRVGANYAPLPYLSFSAGVTGNALVFEYDMRKYTIEKEVGMGGATITNDKKDRFETEWEIRRKVRLWPSLYVGVTTGISKYK